MDWTQIANLALTEIGMRQIADLTSDTSPRAATIRGIYLTLADEVLYARPWKAAMARAVIAADGTSPAFGPAFQYSLPTDPFCLRVWQLGDDDGCWWNERDRAWEVEGRKILTDLQGPLKVRFIGRVADPNFFMGGLAITLAHRLAGAIAYDLTNSREKEASAMQAYAAALAEVPSLDSQQGSPARDYPGDILSARW